jgi:RNA polymerase sigma-70 factor (ECF subfamily)
VDDAALLARIRGGDERAFDTLFRRYYESLVGFAGSVLKDQEAAEDIVQDVMLELWRRRESLDIPESCRSYLFRAVRNRALNDIRHATVAKKAEPTVAAELPEPPHADAPISESELAGAIERAVSALAEPLRDCFNLNRRDGLTYAEIAVTLGISVKTVEARMGRALREPGRQTCAEFPEGGGRR